MSYPGPCDEAKEKLEPGRKLDALVAEKVMGETVVHETWNKGKCQSYTLGPPDYYYDSGDAVGGALSNPVPAYSTSIAAAWEVLDKFPLFEIYLNADSENYSATLIRDLEDTTTWFTAEEDTAPQAICMAALKAVGEKYE